MFKCWNIHGCFISIMFLLPHLLLSLRQYLLNNCLPPLSDELAIISSLISFYLQYEIIAHLFEF